jgi:hypothetical protein
MDRHRKAPVECHPNASNRAEFQGVVDHTTVSCHKNTPNMDLDQGPKKSHGSRPRSGVGGFNVESVYHLHNLYLFEKYSHKKASIRCARKLIGPELIGFETAVGYLPLQTSSKFEADINEGYLFHAARPEQLEAIKQNGLEPPMGHNALSFAESITKAVQDFPSDKHIWVFVVRVCMGKIWMGEHPGPKQNYDSMLTLNGIKGQDTDETLLFREFRIFDKHQAYPEYLLKLTRRQADPDPSNWNIVRPPPLPPTYVSKP